MKTFKILPLILFIYASALGQGEFSVYTLYRTLPQAHQLNPAFRPGGKVIIGLPVLSSSHLSVDMDQLSFDHVFMENTEQSLEIDFNNISSQLKDKNTFSVKSDIQLFFLGLNLGHNFFSLAFNDRINSNLIYTQDIMDLAIYGNGEGTPTFARNIALDKLKLSQNMYHEIALGFNRNIKQKISLGLRVKMLFGVVNSQTEKMNGFIRTDNDSIHFNGSNMAFRNSGYGYLSDDRDPLSIYRSTLPMTNGNNGFGLDAGIHYNLSDRINLSASITDLGYINWKEDTKSYGIDDANYSFKGFDLVDLINNDNSANNFFQNELDSLETMFSVKDTSGISYKSTLTSNIYTGFDYQLAKNHRVGAQIYGKMIDGNITPEFGAYYNLRIGKVINTVVNASFRNGKIHAAGIGASVDLGPVQIYGTTESVTSLIKPEAASLLDARFGINLIFGRKKTKKAAKTEEEIPVDTVEVVSEEPEIEESPVEEKAEPEVVPVPAIIPVVVPVAKKPEPEPVLEEPEPVIEKPKPVKKAPVTVVKQGDHKDELGVGHYIVVGAFLSKTNAQKYSNKLKAKGYNNQFGFLTQKAFYYVTVYKNTGDIEKARLVRNEYRKKKDFLFPDTWLLSVVE